MAVYNIRSFATAWLISKPERTALISLEENIQSGKMNPHFESSEWTKVCYLWRYFFCRRVIYEDKVFFWCSLPLHIHLNKFKAIAMTLEVLKTTLKCDLVLLIVSYATSYSTKPTKTGLLKSGQYSKIAYFLLWI